MARGNWLFVHILSSILVIPVLIVGLATDEWFVVLSLTNSFKIGLTSDCNEWGCDDLSAQKLADYSAGMCDRPVGAVESRLTVSRVLLILSIVLTAAQSVYGLVLWCTRWFNPITNAVHAVVAFLSFLFAFVVVLVFGVMMESWLFCGNTYCEFITWEGQSCANYMGYSYVAVCCATCILFFALLVLLVSMCLTSEHQSITTTVTTVEQRTAKNSSSSSTRRRGGSVGGGELPYRLGDEDVPYATNTINMSRNEPYEEEGADYYNSHNNSYGEYSAIRRRGGAASVPMSARSDASGKSFVYQRGGGGESTDDARRRRGPSTTRGARSNAVPPTSARHYQHSEGNGSTRPASPNNEYNYYGDGGDGGDGDIPALPEELQGGDWSYEADNGYFWSEEKQMYFEPITQQFYDPESNAWFDPESGEWIAHEGDGEE